ncbi:MAG: hypothetical protein ABIX01_01745 [Chitinophagaceae bacterium]
MKPGIILKVFKSGLNYLLTALLFLSVNAAAQPDNWIEQQQLTNTAPGRQASVGLTINGKGYIGLGTQSFYGAFYKDFWEYDPGTNSWSQKADF